MGIAAGEVGTSNGSASHRSLTAGRVGMKQHCAATAPALPALRVVCGNEKYGAGGFVRHGFFVGAHDPHTTAVA